MIGGGISGLTAAWALMRAGVDVRVLEASPRAGGLIQTASVDGFTIEDGPDALLAQKPAGIELCEQLGLGDQVIEMQARGAFVLRDGRLFPLPSPSVLGLPQTWRALARYDLLPWRARLRLAMEPVIPRRRARDDESVAAFFRRRFGAAAVDLIAQPLLGGIHAGDIERLSIASLFPRLVEAERTHGRVWGAFRHARSPSGAAPFRSLRGGMGSLIAALEDRLRDRIRYGCAAARLERRGVWHVEASDGETVDARAVIVAAPASAAAALFRQVDPIVSAACAEVPYVSTAAVSLAIARASVAHPLAGSGFVVARRHSTARITACTWASSKWEARAPEGFVLLRAFIGGHHDPEAVDLDDGELTAIAWRDLRGVLGLTGAPVLARVTRWRHAGPQHVVGHLARVQEIERRLVAHPGLFVTGSGFRAIGIPDCIADARTAATAAARWMMDDG